jgi:hypothetical protein
VYLLFEAKFSSGLADVILLSWSLRYFSLLMFLQVALLYGALYFPILWLVAAIVLVMIIVASREVVRDYRAGKVEATRDYSEHTKAVTAQVVTWMLRIATLLLTIVVMIFTARAYYNRFGLWPLLPIDSRPASSQSAIELQSR